MTEEVAYADLTFQRPYKPESLAECKDIPTPTSRWRFSAFSLLALCLLLLMSLLVLGMMFMQVSMSWQKEYGDLKLTWEELKTNSSRKMLNLKSYLCLKGEETNTKNDAKCALCPTNWHSTGGTGYYISKGLKSWQGSKKFCEARNSTLLMLNEENRELIKETLLEEYVWIGIYKDQRGQWSYVNGTPFATTATWFYQRYNGAKCAYLHNRQYVYTTEDCNSVQRQWICEKAAAELTVEGDPAGVASRLK